MTNKKFLIVEWSGDKLKQALNCYEFLFEELKRFYLAYMFPNAFLLNSSPKPNSNSNLLNQTQSLASNLVNSSSTNTSQTNSTTLNVYLNVDFSKLHFEFSNLKLIFFVRFFILKVSLINNEQASQQQQGQTTSSSFDRHHNQNDEKS